MSPTKFSELANWIYCWQPKLLSQLGNQSAMRGQIWALVKDKRINVSLTQCREGPTQFGLLAGSFDLGQRERYPHLLRGLPHAVAVYLVPAGE
jgi:hypothetical protein